MIIIIIIVHRHGYGYLSAAMRGFFSAEVTRTTVVFRDVIMCYKSAAAAIQQNLLRVFTITHSFTRAFLTVNRHINQT